MKKKKTLGWWIIFGLISGFIISIGLQLIFPNHPFSWIFAIYHSILGMALGGIVGMFYNVTTDDNGDWYGRHYNNSRFKKRYHAGCYGCSRDGMEAKGYCKGCQYYHESNTHCNWSLPDLNDHKNHK